MKHFVTLLLIVLLASCAKTSDVDNLQLQIDDLKSGEIAKIQQQIAVADSTLVVMQDVESLLAQFVTSLRTALGAINGDYNSLNEAVAALQDKDELFGGSINSLRQTLSEGATDVKKWVEDSYATMQAFNALQENVSDINTSIRTIFSRLDSLDVDTQKIANDLREAKTSLTADLGRCQEDIEGIKSDLQRKQGEIDSIRAEMAKIVASVQSVVVVPDYKDGSVRMTSAVSNILRFEVYPLSAASNLATLGASALSLDCVETQTKAGLLTNIPVTEVSFNGEVLLVTADGSALADDIKTGRTTVSARLRISDGTVTRSSEYFGLWYGKDLAIELLPVSGITECHATLHARIDIDKTENDDVFYGFVYSEQNDNLFFNKDLFSVTDTLKSRRLSASGTLECKTHILKSDTQYYYRAFVSKNGVLYYGTVSEFTTKEVDASVVTYEAASILAYKATLNGKLNVNIDEPLDKNVWFLISNTSSTVESLKANGTKENAVLAEDGSYSASVHAIIENTTYYYVSVAKVYDRTVYGNIMSFKTKDDIPEGAVNLGLSVLWGTFNIGATKPEELGDKYAWGETEPQTISYSNTNDYWATYSLCNGSSTTLTKYCTRSTYGIVDNNTILETGPDGDDVASKKLGGQWRMPTWEELLELRNDCSWTWTIDYNETGISGYIIASNVTGMTDRTIFLPRNNSYHDYWSSTLHYYSDKYACMLRLGPSGGISLWGNNTSSGADRAHGRQVRPVTE